MKKPLMEGTRLCIELDDLLTDDVRRELVKHAIFEPTVMEGIGKMLVHGNIEWHDALGYDPWWITWSGKGDVYEKARRVFLGLAGRVTQKLVADLTAERDKNHSQWEENREKLWEAERTIEALRGMVERLRRENCELREVTADV